MQSFELTPNYTTGAKTHRVYQKTFLKYHGRRGRYIRLILEAFAASSSENLADGLAWYDRAQSTARAIHPNVLIGAGVLAALSPRTDWKHNKLYAERVCRYALDGAEYPPPCSTTDRLNKAWKIASLENPTAQQICTILNGPKTCRFFRNIIGDCHAVTIDVWAKRIATGGRDNSAPKPGHDYNTLEQAYQIAAQRLGRNPRDVQAAVWCSARGKAD